MKKAVLLLIILISVSGCGGTLASLYGVNYANPNDYNAVSVKTEIIYDSYEDQTKIKAPIVYAQNNLFGHTYFLRAFAKGREYNNPSVIQIYVDAYLQDWAFLDRAYANGRELNVTPISRDVGSCSSYGCTVHEHIGINITLAELLEYQGTGLNVKISGNKGSITIAIPAVYFKAFSDFLKKGVLNHRISEVGNKDT